MLKSEIKRIISEFHGKHAFNLSCDVVEVDVGDEILSCTIGSGFVGCNQSCNPVNLSYKKAMERRQRKFGGNQLEGDIDV